VGEKWHSHGATLRTQNITSSVRDSWDNRWHPVEPSYVSTPIALGVFAHQTVPESELPRSYLEGLYNIERWTIFPHGGHFAPVEEPTAVAGGLTAFFRGLI
jgi:pimeloyl-ACP methyl ester carboxylesterase